jgi:hypothetical protein
MFRHVVMMRFTPESTPAQVAAMQARLSRLPELIPEIRNYVIGNDARVNDGNYDFVIVADFDDVDDYLAYRDHPDHQAAIAESIRPILADRVAVQHHISSEPGVGKQP